MDNEVVTEVAVYSYRKFPLSKRKFLLTSHLDRNNNHTIKMESLPIVRCTHAQLDVVVSHDEHGRLVLFTLSFHSN